MSGVRLPSPTPNALLLFSPSYVPASLHDRLLQLITPWWRPDGIGSGATAGAEDRRFELLITGAQDLSAAVLANFPNLRLILATSTSFDFIDHEYCRHNGVMICNNPGYTGAAVAEHAFALLLARARHICTLDFSMRRGVSDYDGYVGVELEGKTAGVVGFGDIGQRIARLAQGFGMSVTYTSRRPKPVDGARMVELEELLKTSDVVFLALPLTKDTRGIIDAHAFGMMKRNCILVNVSAEGLVDRDDLKRVLATGRIAGAALDITGSGEPYQNAESVTVTPACGWYTEEAIYRRAATWIDTLTSYLDNRPRYVVQPVSLSA